MAQFPNRRTAGPEFPLCAAREGAPGDQAAGRPRLQTPRKTPGRLPGSRRGSPAREIRTRSARPCGRPLVYQPVIVRSLWSASLGLAGRLLDRRKVRQHQVPPLGERRPRARDRPARRSAIWRKIQGFFIVARPIITPSQPVSREQREGVLGRRRRRRCRSTGIARCRFSSRDPRRSRRGPCTSAGPCARASRRRPRPRPRRSFRGPGSSARLSSRPRRNLTVSGIESRLLHRADDLAARAAGRPSAPRRRSPSGPCWPGQPMLMSQTSGASSSTMSAAAAMRSGSEP